MTPATKPRRLLLLAYYFPPVPANTSRWVAMTKYLRRLGHEVTVVTTGAFGSLADDAGQDVVRTADLISAELPRRLLRRPALPQGGAPAPLEKPPPGLLTKLLVPELTVLTWVPAALRAARRLVAERGIDCVITTSPSEATMLAGVALSGGPAAWLADFRDPWTFEPLRPRFPTAAQRALDRRLERLVVERADAVTAVQGVSAQDLRSRFGVPAVQVRNGWDPELEPVGAGEPPEAGSDVVTLVHTGLLSGGWGRRPDALFDAMRLLRGQEPRLGERLRLLLAGRLTIGERELLDGLDLGGAVRHLGHLSRPESIALQRSADALLIVGSHRRSEAPGKLLEYLGARRPVIVLGTEHEAARIVRETGTGVCVAQDDVQGIAAALREVADGTARERYRPHDLERYVYPAPAEEMAEAVERAVARRAERRR